MHHFLFFISITAVFSQTLIGLTADTESLDNYLVSLSVSGQQTNITQVNRWEMQGCTLDDGHGIFYCVQGETLLAYDVKDGTIIRTVSLPSSAFGELQYDQKVDKLLGYALDSAHIGDGLFEINTMTGAVSLVSAIDKMYAYIEGSSTYDQVNGRFFLCVNLPKQNFIFVADARHANETELIPVKQIYSPMAWINSKNSLFAVGATLNQMGLYSLTTKSFTQLGDGHIGGIPEQSATVADETTQKIYITAINFSNRYLISIDYNTGKTQRINSKDYYAFLNLSN